MESVTVTVCWENSDSQLLLNSSYSQADQQCFLRILDEATDYWPAHIWLSTSGTSSQKWVGLSKQALLCSASAVNQHLLSDHTDRWVHALPEFHVGGLGIRARAHLSGSPVFDFKKDISQKWQAKEFYHYVQQVKGTLTSLVPTQLHDLIDLGLYAPKSLRAVIIGGGALPVYFYEKAIALGWPLLPSYGLTECASQVATAALDSWKKNKYPALELLSHIHAEERAGSLSFASPSLLTTYAWIQNERIQFFDPKIQGLFISEDLGRIQNGCIHLLGRKDHIVKIGGENVDLGRLELHLQTLRMQLKMKVDATLLSMPDQRLGYCIHLASNALNNDQIAPLIQSYQESVLPFERIRKTYFVSQIPRSSLGKILKKELIDLLHNL